jgi:acyl-coenzyme A thioesterase PaaI-like protein
MSEPSTAPAVQDFYPDDFAHCYGCGRLNRDGHHVRTQWEGDETVSRFTPRPYEMAVPGFVYGGLIASLIDCHAMGTAAAATLRAAGQDIGQTSSPRFVTASLRVDFLKPTPLGPELVIRGRARETGERKVIVEATVSVGDTVTARGEAVAVRMPATMAAAVR